MAWPCFALSDGPLTSGGWSEMGSARCRLPMHEGMGVTCFHYPEVGWLRPFISPSVLRLLNPFKPELSPHHTKFWYASSAIEKGENLPSFRHICLGWWWQLGRLWGLEDKKVSISEQLRIRRKYVGCAYTSFSLYLVSNVVLLGKSSNVLTFLFVNSSCVLSEGFHYITCNVDPNRPLSPIHLSVPWSNFRR